MKRLIAVAIVITVIILGLSQLISHQIGVEKFNNWPWIIAKLIVALVIAFISFIFTVWIEGEVSRLDPDSLRAVGKSEFFILLAQSLVVFVGVLIIAI